jgi:hypothetical protein
MPDLDPTKKCENCDSIMKLYWIHPRLQLGQYICPVCNELEYNDNFPTDEMKIEDESQYLFDYINKDVFDKDMHKKVLMNLVEKINKSL